MDPTAGARTSDQVLHDRINLPRFVNKIEKFVSEEDWSHSSQRETWLKSQSTLQRIRHARLLLKNVEVDDRSASPASEHRYQRLHATLEQVEAFVKEVEQRAAPPASSTPAQPHPQQIRAPANPIAAESTPLQATLIPSEDVSQSATPLVNAMLSSSQTDPSEPLPLLPPTLPAAPAATSNVTAMPTFLQNSRALQDELTGQLALMAAQLRRNATHFADSLVKDNSVVEGMHEKLDGNLSAMKNERGRLKDLRGKSGGTTCLVVMSVIVVLLAFVLMIFVIRVT